MLKDLIIKNGGATIDRYSKPVKFKTGYQVSVTDIGCIAVADFTEQMAQDVVTLISKRGEYAGFWVDDGYVYADLSRRVSTKKDALKLGKELKQRAIWQWGKERSVACA